MNTHIFKERGIYIFCLSLLLAANIGHAVTLQSQLDTSYWSMEPTIGLFFSQHSFSEYYKGGGVNSIALGNHLDLAANYERSKNSWQNRLTMRYGVIKMADQSIQKNEDHLELNSKYGRTFSEHLQASALLNLSTRIHDVYELSKTGRKGKLIGNFLAPAYINLGTGIDYLTKDKSISLFYTPINSKVTIVNHDALAAQFLGGREDRHTRYELGSLIKFEIKKKVMENVFIHSTGTFFTNHLEDFGKIDVNLENRVNFKVNKFFSVNLLTHLVYDEDILFTIASDQGENAGDLRKGPRTQFKEVLNIGLSHTF